MPNPQKKITYKKGETITKEGDLAFEWYILSAGKVGVFREGKLLSEFTEKGMIFGELSGILARPRTATMKAMEDSDVIVVDKSIDEVIRNYPDVAHKILINLAERLANTTDELFAIVDNKK